MKNPDITCRREMTEYLLSLFLMVSLLQAGKHYSQFMTVAVCLLPAVCLFMLRAVIRLAGKGTDDLLISLTVPGILFIAGGPVFDLSVTLISTPDLKREANEYVRVLLDSGNSPVFAYLYLFLAVIVWAAVIKSILWIALIKHRSLTVFNNTNIFFWTVVLILTSSNITSWLYGIRWLGIEISRVQIISVGIIFSYLCLCLYAARIWKSYKKLYQSEITVKLRLHIISAIFTSMIVFAVCSLFIVRNHVNKANLRYLDDIINYVAENKLMNRYAEIDDTIQEITSNPYIGKKQTNGADALWEYCSYNSEERREDFVSRINKTSEILEFSERLKLDGRLAATADNFSTEIVDNAWKYNVLLFGEKLFPYKGQVSGTVLLTEHRFPRLINFYYYSEIMTVRICRLNRQGKNSSAKELYLKTLHISWMLFNGDTLLSQAAGLSMMKNLCHDEIIGLEIFSEYERKYLNKLKENMLFISDNGILYNCFKLIRLIKPVVFITRTDIRK